MSTALDYRVSRDVANLVLNTIYAIFLGLLFTFFFEQDVDEGIVKNVYFLVNKGNWLTVVSISTYFFLDWLTTNLTVSIKGDMSHWLLMTLVLLISYLGALVVMAFSPSPFTIYLLFGLYACIVPWWDLIVQAPACTGIGRSIVTGFAILFRVIVGAYMLAAAIVAVVREVIVSVLPLLLVMYVILKFIRYIIYVHYDMNSEEV